MLPTEDLFVYVYVLIDILPSSTPGTRIHMFGYESDIERADVLYTSVLVQMWQGLAGAAVPAWTSSPRAWRRSWLLGFTTAVVARVRAAEQHAAEASVPQAGAGTGAALVLADRKQVISRAVQQAYPVTRTAKVTYSGSGYSSGYAKGQQADLGGSRLPGAAGKAIGGGR